MCAENTLALKKKKNIPKQLTKNVDVGCVWKCNKKGKALICIMQVDKAQYV